MSTTNTLSAGEIGRVIDQRLDTIDRALFGLLPRQDRLSIVTQVEARLREVAAANTAVDSHEQAPVEPATVTSTNFGGVRDRAAPGRRRPTSPARRHGSSARRKQSRLALSSGVLGIVALALLFALPVTYLVVTNADLFDEAAEVLVGTHLAAVATAGALAVALGVAGLVRLQGRSRQMAGHGWAITGLCTGPLPMFVGGLLVLVVGLQLAGAGTSNVPTITTTSATVTVPAPSYAPATGYPACMPATPTPDVPTVWNAPTMCPAPACPDDVSRFVVEAPPQDAVPGPPSPAEPPILGEPPTPLDPPSSVPHVAESAPRPVE